MNQPAPCRRFTPPNTFRAKVPNTGGISLEEMEAAANEALAELETHSADWMRADVEKLTGHLAAAADAAPDEVAEHVDAINKIAHDLKSLAGQFSLPMIGHVGQLLCDFIAHEPALARSRLDILRVHIDAIVLVLARGLAGDGGEAGAHLLAALQKAVDKARAQQAGAAAT